MNFEKLELFLDSQPNIHFDITNACFNPQSYLVPDLIFWIFDRCKRFHTVYDDGRIQCTSSYYCRSIGDIYKLVNYYSEKHVSIQSVYEGIIDLFKSGKSICSWICNDVGKRVYFIPEYDPDSYFNSYKTDEYGYPFHLISVLPRDEESQYGSIEDEEGSISFLKMINYE